MWSRYCCLTSFFPIVNTCLCCEDIVQQFCVMVCRWRTFWQFLCPVFSASRVQLISAVHSKFALRPHHVWKYGRHPICKAENRRGKKEEKEDRNHGCKIQCPHLLHRAAIIIVQKNSSINNTASFSKVTPG